MMSSSRRAFLGRRSAPDEAAVWGRIPASPASEYGLDVVRGRCLEENNPAQADARRGGAEAGLRLSERVGAKRKG